MTNNSSPVSDAREKAKEQTAMQEAIDDLKFMANKQTEPIPRIAFNMAITICEQHLEREKEQHFKTYIQCIDHNMKTEDTPIEEQIDITKGGMFWKEFSDYFTTNYNQ